VKVRILPSSPDTGHLQHLISFVVDGRIAVDAGCVGLCGTARSQTAITSVVLTHSHMDHVCSLPILAMNVLDCGEQDGSGRRITAYAPAPVIESLRQDLFNWRVWPDFTALEAGGRPLLPFVPIEPRRPTVIDGLTVTAIPVNHPVPTVGYLIDDGQSAVLFALDTGPTEEIWTMASGNPRLAAAFIDVAFPDEMSELAEASGHLTPRLVGEQLAHMPEAVARIAVHLKPAYYDQIVEGLGRVGIPNLSVGRLGHDYEF
jgi:ribonuclease BN (tRNA processing enzyme)